MGIQLKRAASGAFDGREGMGIAVRTLSLIYPRISANSGDRPHFHQHCRSYREVPVKPHDIACALVRDFAARDNNEADTRHRIIDQVLHEVWSWPRNRVRCEEYVRPGYADYVLERPDGGRVLIVEAKKEGNYFRLPEAIVLQDSGSYVNLRALLTEEPINSAITQVRTYCLDKGCDIAAITNGHEWIFFKAFEKDADWRTLKAFVINGLGYFDKHIIEAVNHLSYTSIISNGSLRRLLLDTNTSHRDLFYPKRQVPSYDAPVDANPYASSLRPIADQYFGVIQPDDPEFMERCYVSDREYDLAFANARRRLEDAITPYLKQYGVQDFADTATGGKFGKRITKSVLETRAADVVVLFGGKGVGKSTFLRKLLFHRPPQILKKHAIVALGDLLNTGPQSDVIRNWIWETVIAALDTNSFLAGDRETLCKLFKDRFDAVVKQDLFGLKPSSEAYNTQLNAYVREWKADKVYVATRLAQHARRQHKAPIVIVDNTDQLKEELQELCFSVAQEVSKALGCLVIISMREERFYASSIHGLLDAYQNSSFHITGPAPTDVFLKRIEYVKALLSSDDEAVAASLPGRLDRETIAKLFGVFEQEFGSRHSHLASFLSACTRGNIRLALEFFRGFLVSGYTQVGEMTANETWTLQIHQVLKPFMIPSRFFYDEQYSRIPNIFQIRSKSMGSHFTAMRILADLAHGHDAKSPPFLPVAKLLADCVDTFGMREDFELNMNMLLAYGLIESNNRLEAYDSRVDSVKITPYGFFMLNYLSHAFTYVELVSVDCAIGDQGVANTIAEYANDDYRQYLGWQRMARVRTRIDKAGAFIAYLEAEEARETDLFKLHDRTRLTPKIRSAFQDESQKVFKSARRNVGDQVRTPRA